MLQMRIRLRIIFFLLKSKLFPRNYLDKSNLEHQNLQSSEELLEVR
ncbi:unnamed protein product [Larinioides sclopetarius]|uniref:Uncharacterized protein n=1 Tax=Larinioides sclopetarius TaxID=280406 RepID=A0AAV2AP85_9ARAC